MSLRDLFHSAKASWSAGLRVWIPGTLLAMVAVYIIWRVLQPAPPQHIIIAAGAPGGSYDTFARQYSEFFKQNGFELEVRNTAGSIENFALLEDEKSGVDVALVQGGTTPEYAREKLQAVCSVYLEPLWVFYRDERPVRRLSELKGKRLAIGAEGSGVRPLATRLLQDNGFSTGDGTQLSDLTGLPAAEALKAGQLDAAFLVIAPENPAIQQLIDRASCWRRTGDGRPPCRWSAP